MRKLAGSVLFATLLFACDRAPSSTGLPEWTPADHDQEPGQAQKGNQGAKGSGGGAAVQVELAWRNQCSTCHGAAGKGDGPQGPMFKPPDFTAAAFQDKEKDEDLENAIRNGKGRMPKFDLPDPIVLGLVARVRAFGGRQAKNAPPASSGGTAPDDVMSVAALKQASETVKRLVAEKRALDPDHPERGNLMVCQGINGAELDPKLPADVKASAEEAKKLCAFEVPLLWIDELLKRKDEMKVDGGAQMMCGMAQKQLDKAKASKPADPRVKDAETRIKQACK